ncbi:MAG: hypothetical protein GKS03_14435 [Alphaproteobacteria bacterium]|nr:hypothetical protein [Alphaproteobacteria bacterium]
MDPNLVFPTRVLFSEPWEVRFVVSAMVVLVILGLSLLRLNRRRPADIYDPQRAWLRAGLYFTSCFLISWAAGILPTLRSSPIASAGQLSDPVWWLATVALTAVIVFGYGVVWRKGTVPHGRPLFILPVLVFGILWGLATGELLLSVWSLIEKTGFGPVAAAVGTFLVGGSLNGLWHSKYWDSRVSPEHNILETNKKKILLAHFPNLIFSLVHLAVFSNPYVFVFGQVLALTISTWVMHFPPFWGPNSAMVPQHNPEGRPRAEITSP